MIKIVVLLGIIYIIYLLFIDIPNTKLENKIKMVKSQYNFCLKTADDVYFNGWESECILRGKDKDCMLPTYSANSRDAMMEKDKTKCLEIYKTDMKMYE